MAKTNIFIEDANVSAELAYIKTSQNLLNKVTSKEDCNAFMGSPTTYADLWQIVFLEGRDTIWTQGNEYGTSADDITYILGYINDINSDLADHQQLIDALNTFVGAKPVASKVRNTDDPTGENTSIVDAIQNIASYLDTHETTLNSYNDRITEVENRKYSLTENSAYLTLTVSEDKLSYELGTTDLMSATQITSEISRIDNAINDLTASSVVKLESQASESSDNNAKVNISYEKAADGSVSYKAYLSDVASKTRVYQLETDLNAEDERISAYLTNLVTNEAGTEKTHNTVADYVTSYISYEIAQVKNNANDLDGRVDTLETDMQQAKDDIDALELAYAVTAWQGETNVTGTSVNLAHGGAFTLKQNNGNTNIVTINLPADMVVQSGKVITATAEDVTTYSADNLVEGNKYIKLIIANDPDSPLFVDTTNLVDIYTVSDTDTVDLNIDNNNNITANITDKYVGYMDGAIKDVKLIGGTEEGHVTLSYTKNDGTTGSENVNLESYFVTPTQLQTLSNESLKSITINGYTFDSDSTEHVFDGDDLNVSYNTTTTPTTGTLNEAIAEIEKKIKNAQDAGVQSITGEGVTVSPSTGDVTITATGSTVKSETLTGTAYAKSNETIDANLTYIDKQVQTNAANIQTNANDIAAIKAALNWTIIGS